MKNYHHTLKHLLHSTRKLIRNELIIINIQLRIWPDQYRLVHDVAVDEESPTSSKSDPETDCDTPAEAGPHVNIKSTESSCGQGPRNVVLNVWNGNGERRRRKLPEIPKNKKCK